ncbi:MAG: DNA-binding protein [Streptococcaceae bacterium]|jgi:predicted DNA-binding protein YlxM (UPF0122 family)|nr:DNA-binding protein [Streptococcaceae bacterium]
MTLEKTTYMNSLYDSYGELLTPRQRAVFESHYQEDFSLSEIAENIVATKQAVSQLLKTAEKQLTTFETHLHLVENQAARNELMQTLLSKYPTDTTLKDLANLL